MRSFNIKYLLCLSLLFAISKSNFAQYSKRYEDSLLLVVEVTKNDSIRFGALNNLFSYYRNSNTQKALIYAKIIYVYADSIPGKLRMGRAYNCLSLVYTDLGDLDSALKYSFKNLEYNEQTKDSINIAGAYLNIGKLYTGQNNNSEGANWYRKSLDLFKRLNHPLGMGVAYNNCATIYKKSASYDTALLYFKYAFKYKMLSEDKSSAASTLMNIGDLFQSLNKSDSVFKYYTQALAIANEVNNVRLKLQIFSNFGRFYSASKDFEKAEKYFLDAYSIALLMHLKPDLENITAQMVNMYELKNDFKNAYKYATINLIYKDSLFTESNARQINELQVKYETTKNEEKIAILNQQKKINHEQLLRNRSLIVFASVLFLLFVVICVLLFKRNQITQQSNLELEHKNHVIDEQKSEITDSIKYAKKIQESLLPRLAHINKILPNSFLIYKPKNIVSGDFYWVHKSGNDIYIVLADNLLQGVPGAFMSLVGMNLLNRALDNEKIKDIVKIKRFIADEIATILKGSAEYNRFTDKLAFSILKHDTEKNTLEYLSADNALYISDQSGALTEIKSETSYKATNLYQLTEGDTVYMFTDGFADQLGGGDGKKMLNKRVFSLIQSMSKLDLGTQKEKLLDEFESWKGTYEQTDDILILVYKI
jgi:serine phosphatase RsbU (regulator of sigma subunit)